MSDIEQASAVRLVAGVDGDADAAWYETELDGDWSVGVALNGGYLQLPMARAALAESPLRHLAAMTTDFLAAPKPGPARLRVVTTKRGRTAAFHQVSMHQGDRLAVTASVVTTDLSADDEPVISRVKPPLLPAVEDCQQTPAELGGMPITLMNHLDLRLAPETIRSLLKHDGAYELSGWIRMADGTPTDQYTCLQAADGLPPVTATLPMIAGWAPTVQLSTYFRAVPEPGWLRAHVRGTLLAGGWFDEECALFDSADRLVAQSRQLARAPR